MLHERKQQKKKKKHSCSSNLFYEVIVPWFYHSLWPLPVLLSLFLAMTSSQLCEKGRHRTQKPVITNACLVWVIDFSSALVEDEDTQSVPVTSYTALSANEVSERVYSPLIYLKFSTTCWTERSLRAAFVGSETAPSPSCQQLPIQLSRKYTIQPL